MSKNVEFHSYSVNVKTALKDKAIAFLQEFKNVVVSHKALIEAELEQQKKDITDSRFLSIQG